MERGSGENNTDGWQPCCQPSVLCTAGVQALEANPRGRIKWKGNWGAVHHGYLAIACSMVMPSATAAERRALACWISFIFVPVKE